MLTKHNVSVNDETIIGLRATKAAVQDYGGVQNIPIILDMITVVEKCITCILSIWDRRQQRKAQRKEKRQKQKPKRENSKKRKLKTEL